MAGLIREPDPMPGVNATPRYVGRFAPSPTGALHSGSLVAALASWLDAKAHGGQWLVRIEDVDTERCLPGLDRVILRQLAECGLQADAPPVWQSLRGDFYQRALDSLVARGLAYPCACSRKDIEAALSRQGRARARHEELIYPGTCRAGLHGHSARSWRLRTDPGTINFWSDRRLGPQQQDVAAEVGDFVLKRADDCFSYQLAVVVDDAESGVTDVVRGEDLADNTARQIWLQKCLALPTPRYLHTPLVLGANGEKLSKQNGALPLDTTDPLAALNRAAGVLGLHERSGSNTAITDVLNAWALDWRRLYNPVP